MFAADVKIVEAGPWRVIGLKTIARCFTDCYNLWTTLAPRIPEISPLDNTSPNGPNTFGLCFCCPPDSHYPQGSFHYIAGIAVTPQTPIPLGMVEHHIPAGPFLVIPVLDLLEIPKAWASVCQELASLPQWEAYCGPQGCHCDQRNNFAFYPPNFRGHGPFSLYIPIRKIVSRTPA